MIIFRKFLTPALFCLLQISALQTALGENKMAENKTNKKSNSPIITTTIRANFIDIKRQNETVKLTGNVTLEREDANMKADEMMVYYYENKEKKDLDKKKKDSKINSDKEDEEDQDNKKNLTSNKDQKDLHQANSSIKKIEAKNNVKIFNGEFVATGKYGFYNPEQHNFILEKDVIFNNGTSIAKGQKFVYNLKTKKGNLVGNKNLPIDKKTNPIHSEDFIKEDGRVIVIIDDNDIGKAKKSSKNNEENNTKK